MIAWACNLILFWKKIRIFLRFLKQAYSKLIGHIWPRTFWLMRKSLLHRAVSFVNWLETLNWVEWNIAVQNKCVYAAFSSTLYVWQENHVNLRLNFPIRHFFVTYLGPEFWADKSANMFYWFYFTLIHFWNWWKNAFHVRLSCILHKKCC